MSRVLLNTLGAGQEDQAGKIRPVDERRRAGTGVIAGTRPRVSRKTVIIILRKGKLRVH